MADEVMPPYLESMNHCCQLKIVDGVIVFMLSQLMRCKRNYVAFLCQHASKSLS
jgi:hypothetical protein